MMNRSRAALLGVVGLVGIQGAAPAAAQQVEIGLHGGRVTDERGVEHTGATLAPVVAWVDGTTVVRLHGQATLLGGGAVLGGGGVDGRIALLGSGPVTLAVTGSGWASGASTGYRALAGRVGPQLQVTGESWGVAGGPYMGSGGESYRGEVPTGGLFPQRREAWSEFETRSVSGAAADVWAGTGPLSLRAGWSSAESEGVRWQDVTAAAQVAAGPVVLGATMGHRQASTDESWYSGSVSLRIAQGTYLAAELGGYPSDPMTGRAAGSYATVGLRFRTGDQPAAPRTVPVTRDGHIQLTLRAEPGSRVEILGDWTDWQPQPVKDYGDGVYRVEVRLPPGVHRFIFRVNGEWRIPRGFETEPDGFGGKRAVLRV